MIRVEGLVKRFGRRAAVDRISIEVVAGELLAILGPSGCGKTTLLRMLGGYETPDEGRILISGKDVTREPPERRNLGMVFQNYALFPHMTALENVEFGLRMRGVDRRTRRERAVEALRLTGLNGEGSRRPSRLSGGEQQRVAVARALANDPALVFADEPTGNLDHRHAANAMELIRGLCTDTGAALLLVSHDREIIAQFEDVHDIAAINRAANEEDAS